MIKGNFYLILTISLLVFISSCGSFPGTSCGGSLDFGEFLLEDSSNIFFAENTIPSRQVFVDKSGNKRTYTLSKNLNEKFTETLLLCEDADQLQHVNMTGQRRLVKFEFTSNYDNDDTYGYELLTQIAEDKEGNLLVIDVFYLSGFAYITSRRENEVEKFYLVNGEPDFNQINSNPPEFHKDTTILGRTFFNVYHSTVLNDMLFSEGVGVVALIDRNVLWVLDE
jgi:hypothetical protein